jgi:hypothetical protein
LTQRGVADIRHIGCAVGRTFFPDVPVDLRDGTFSRMEAVRKIAVRGVE